MAYTDLTPEQQGIVDQHQVSLRAAAGTLSRLLTNMQAVDDFYNAEASAVLALLLGADEIPNPGGLDQAAPLTKDETISIQADFQNILTTYDTAARRQNYSRAAGIAAIVI